MDINNYCTGFQHLGLPTADMDKTLKFYEKLGFSPIYNTLNEGSRVFFLQLGDMIIETYESDSCVGASGAIDHISLNVKNVDEVFAWAKAENFKTDDNEVNYLPFFEKGVRFFTIIGPNAEKVEFNQKC